MLISSVYILIFSCLVQSCLAQAVVPHPVPEEYVSSQYNVMVNKKPVPVFHAGLNVCFASFDFEGTVEVKVSAAQIRDSKTTEKKYAGQVLYSYTQTIDGAEFWAGNASVKPASKKITPETDGADVTFSLTEPGQYTVERPGTSNFNDQVLFLFANRPEKKRPNAGDPGIIYFGPGVHQQNIDLQSGQTLYLDAGAVLFGAINIWDAKDVKILGRGTVLYYGPQSEDKAPIGWGHQKAMGNDLKFWYPLNTRNTERFTVEGITLIGRSRTFMVNMITTFDAVFDNVKLLSVNRANVNGDGFDWFGGGRTIIRNSLIRSQDDCFAFYIATHDNSNPQEVRRSSEVRNIHIENCVLWSTIANVFRVGHGAQALITDNVTLSDCDIIHIGRGEWLAPWSIVSTVTPSSPSKAIHSNYLLEDLRFEEATAFLGLQNSEAVYRNFVFRNITMNGNPVPSMVQSRMEGLTFDNVMVNGIKVDEAKDVPFGSVTTEIKDLHFK
jgi:hypothetical protein